MSYFHDLRNLIEKEGLPGTMAELADGESGDVIADVGCGEGVHGIWVSGAARPGVAYEAGPLPNPDGLLLRNFRLPDPPLSHRGEEFADLRFSAPAGLAIDFLWTEVIGPAHKRFVDGADM